MVALVLSCDDDVRSGADWSFGQVEVFGDNCARVREVGGGCGGIADDNGEYHHVAEGGEGFGNASVTDDEEFRGRQYRLDEDVHGSSARHSDAELFVGHIECNDKRRACFEALQGFAADSAFGTAASDPSGDELPLGVNEGLGTARRRR